jgi:hypothetical protein
MARPVMPQIRSINEDEISGPKHIIIWLDKHIGKPEECILLKCTLFLAVDPTTGLYERNLNQDDLDRSILLNATLLVQLDNVEFMFQAFVDVEKCFEAIEKHRLKRRIFFITSGSKGRIIIPSLMINFPDTFVPNYRMYIFCANTLMVPVEGVDAPTNTWALNFLENILMMNHQDDLFARMVSDIAEHFFTEAQRLSNNDGQLDSACQYLVWSKQMFRRYGIMERRSMTTKITEIDQRITLIKKRIRAIERQRNPPSDDDDDDERAGEATT